MSITITQSANWRDAARAELQDKFVAELNQVAEFTKQEQEAAAGKAAAIQRARDLLNAARALGIPLDDDGAATPDDPEEPQEGGAVTAREIILDELQEKPGMKAAELKKAIERRLGREVHYKTPGMTLYRLANDGLVRREGHRWFALRGDQQRATVETEKELPLMK
ncbi:hypothetical protein [Tsuneonella rigui]|uniref:hypothetical protein n=1 Tax=Tsuneonella rigui TaxID=1708790 RepID=UPI000F7DD6EA|nr:hypothetical protein [Tsuneonella rigui]